jgi:BON domain
MNWFDYGFSPAQFSPAAPGSQDPRTAGLPTPQQGLGFSGANVPHTMLMFPTAYALQSSPSIAAYPRQPFALIAGAGNGYAVPGGPFPVVQDAQALPTLQTAAWPSLQESSPLRAIGFQPPIPTTAQFQPVFQRIPNDDEIEDLIEDALEAYPFLSANSEVEVRCESGQVTLKGSAQHKRVKHAIGEIAWSVPGILDVQNNIELAHRRRRAGLRRENPTAAVQPRK